MRIPPSVPSVIKHIGQVLHYIFRHLLASRLHNKKITALATLIKRLQLE
jgi:hypothetical protein